MKKHYQDKQKQEPKSAKNNKLTLSQENFKIFLRVKPILAVDSQKQSVKIINNQKVQVIPPPYSPITDAQKIYQYEQVFDGVKNNKQIFDKTMIQPINNALAGYNSTIFIYGMTGAGKTYTMFGNSQAKNYAQQGLVSMTIDYMFDHIYQQKNVKSQISVSFFQIYNQNIRDLLQENSQNLPIMEDPIRGVFINDLMELKVQEIHQTKDIIGGAVDKRAMNATKSNEVSSRSHAILQFNIKRYIEGQNDEVSLIESKFFMIDLAGNEKTFNNEAKRFIEGVNINKSLLTLGKCFNILAQKKNTFVPFRDSKLTRILKQSLGGNSKTVMISCISPERKYYEETLNTLKYSSVAKKIKNKGIKNNTKILSKNQIPCDKEFINNNANKMHLSDDHRKINNSLLQFLDLMNQKYKIQKIQEDLQYSRNENERLLDTEEGEACHKNVKKIQQVSAKLNEVYDENLSKADQIYKNMISEIFLACDKTKNERANMENQRIQIIRLNQLNRNQKNKIKQLQQKINGMSEYAFSEHCTSIAQLESVRKSENASYINSTFSQQKENKRLSHNEQTNRISSRTNTFYKNLQIDVSMGEESNRSAYQQKQNNSFSQLCLQKRKSQDKKSLNKMHKNIIINLNHCQSTNPDRQSFLKKLKETEKKANKVSQSQISELLEEQDNKRYELGNVEVSMLRKLRFFQRERNIQKSNSVGGISVRNVVSVKK